MSEIMSREAWNKIVDDYIHQQNELMQGKRTTPDPADYDSFPQWHKLITAEVIAGYANGTGNPDPLFNDENYGKNTRWGSMIAPPGRFVEYIAYPGSTPSAGLATPPGMNKLYGGTEYTYFGHQIRPGDAFHLEDTFLGWEEKASAGKPYRLLTVRAKRAYKNQNDETAVETVMTGIITCTYPEDIKGDGAARTTVKERQHASQEVLDEIHRNYDDELAGKHRCGARIRFFEDVQEGEPLQTLIKGPLDLLDHVSFCTAVGQSFGAFATKWATLRDDLHFIDPMTGDYTNHALWHFSDSMAQSMGVPFALCFGALSECNMAHIVTNWMGDDGYVVSMSTSHRRMHFLGDISYVKGFVEKKHIAVNGDHLVDLQVWNEDQNGVKYTTMKATVKLLSRE